MKNTAFNTTDKYLQVVKSGTMTMGMTASPVDVYIDTGLDYPPIVLYYYYEKGVDRVRNFSSLPNVVGGVDSAFRVIQRITASNQLYFRITPFVDDTTFLVLTYAIYARNLRVENAS